MNIPVKYTGYLVVMSEDGEWVCPHDTLEYDYDAGGDGITEPGASWSIYCNDCQNEDMTQFDADWLIENHIEELRDNQEEREYGETY